jgi:hypothetical protein
MREPSRTLTLALPGILTLALACSGEGTSRSGDEASGPSSSQFGPDGVTPLDPTETGEPGQQPGAVPGGPGALDGPGGPVEGVSPVATNPDGSPVQEPGGDVPAGQPGPDGPGSTPVAGGPACPSQGLTATPLRRLTSYEYGNSARDLLGVQYDAEAELPTDEKVTDGYSNNSAVLTVSDLHAEKYVLVSEAMASLAVQDLTALAPCDGTDEAACALNAARTLGRKAFRRPITADDEAVLMTAYDAGATGGSYQEGIEVMIRAMLQSPHFIYRTETSPAQDPNAAMIPLSQYELATRLSYLVWASGPSDELLDAAERGELATKEQIAAMTRTLLQDERASRGLIHFYEQWLGLTRLDVMSKNETLFPLYSGTVREAMAAEFPAFMNYVLTEAPTVRELLTSQVAFVNAQLAPIYGMDVTDAALTRVTLPAEQNRAGILTQAGFLAVQAHPDQTSPVLRGKTVRARMLCHPVPPPPDDVDITVPDVSSAGTARERFSAHFSAGDSCATCHELMDPIGFAFEHFDAIGQYRTTENGQTIDVMGNLVVSEGMVGGEEIEGEFVGVRELAEKLADSNIVRDCVATEWFRFSAGRKESPSDSCSLETLRSGFANSGGDLNELVVAMTQTDAFWFRAPIAEEVTQ